MWWLFWNVNRSRAAVINQRLWVWQDGRLAQLYSWMKTSLVRREKTSCILTVWRNWNSTSLGECYDIKGDRGITVVKVLCYKSEGHWFDPSWCQWIFAISTQVFLGFPVPKSKCWDGSQDPKLPLRASHVANPELNLVVTNFMFCLHVK